MLHSQRTSGDEKNAHVPQNSTGRVYENTEYNKRQITEHNFLKLCVKKWEANTQNFLFILKFPGCRMGKVSSVYLNCAMRSSYSCIILMNCMTECMISSGSQNWHWCFQHSQRFQFSTARKSRHCLQCPGQNESHKPQDGTVVRLSRSPRILSFSQYSQIFSSLPKRSWRATQLQPSRNICKVFTCNWEHISQN